MEKDDEVKGNDNHLNFGTKVYDSKFERKLIQSTLHQSKALFILIMLLQISCATRVETDLERFKKVYTEGQVRYDSVDDIYILNNYLKDSVVREALVFDSTEKYIEYVFYNVLNNEPRYLMMIDSQGSLDYDEGDPLYLVSEYFKKYLQEHDTFSVNIYLATPPNYLAHVRICQFDSTGNIYEVASKAVESNHQVMYVGNIDNRFRKGDNDLCVISEIIGVGGNPFIRSDTAFFTIKVK